MKYKNFLSLIIESNQWNDLIEKLKDFFKLDVELEKDYKEKSVSDFIIYKNEKTRKKAKDLFNDICIDLKKLEEKNSDLLYKDYYYNEIYQQLKKNKLLPARIINWERIKDNKYSYYRPHNYYQIQLFRRFAEKINELHEQELKNDIDYQYKISKKIERLEKK